MSANVIKISATVNAPVEKVWLHWNEPELIRRWNHASDDWHCPASTNDLRPGGRFVHTMAAKDGSASFDFAGEYTNVSTNERIEYTMDDGRKVKVVFTPKAGATLIETWFEAENTNSLEMQEAGWQAILNNFKQHTENFGKKERIYFNISIKAPIDKVFEAMIDKEIFKQWCAEFNPTSYYEGSWAKGEKILFIGLDEEGKKSGMVSYVREMVPPRYISLKHAGLISNGAEITEGPLSEEWNGAMENYILRPEGDHTVLEVEVDVTADMKDYFQSTWPKALARLKEICEK